MSGIVALIHKDKSPIDQTLLASLTKHMAFRGPDSQNIWCDNYLGFGHCMLKVSFESQTEKQPLSFDDRIHIVADARIDERRELIAKLNQHGKSVAHDAADVDLILHSYHIWQEHCLEHLIGDFAFVIWDGEQQTIFAAHDHVGITPLYYADTEDFLILSNTLNCIRQHPAVSNALNKKAVGDFLCFSVNMDLHSTTFRDIQRLPPTHSLKYKNGKIKLAQYWSLPQTSCHRQSFFAKDHIEKFCFLLNQAVSDRLRTNQVATHLSGGLDSTSIAAVANEILRCRNANFDFRSYTIVYRELLDEQEGPYAKMVADYLRISNVSFIAEDYINAIPSIDAKYALPEPGSIPQNSAEFDILHHITKHCRLLLVGFGGDPLFSGYKNSKITTRNFILGQYHRLWSYIRWPIFYWNNFLYFNFLKQKNPPLPTKMPFEWLSSDLDKFYQPQQRQEEISAMLSSWSGKSQMLQAPLWSFIFNQSDSGSHRLPLKVCFPFFDLRLVKFMSEICPLPWYKSKLLLRETMHNRLPDSILRRPKSTLPGNPYYNWAKSNGMQHWMQDLLNTPGLSEYVQANIATDILSSPQNYHPAAYSKMHNILNFAYWLRTNANIE